MSRGKKIMACCLAALMLSVVVISAVQAGTWFQVRVLNVSTYQTSPRLAVVYLDDGSTNWSLSFQSTDTTYLNRAMAMILTAISLGYQLNIMEDSQGAVITDIALINTPVP